MQPVPIHAGPFIVAVLVKIVVGALWYSPALFLKQWQQLAGVTDEQMKGGIARGMTTWIVGALLMTFVLTHAVYYAGAKSFGTGAAVGFFNWLGFVLVVQLDDWAAAKRSAKLVAINGGSTLVALVIMGADSRRLAVTGAYTGSTASSRTSRVAAASASSRSLKT